MSFAKTDCFGPHNIEKRIMVKKSVKRYRSNNLKNDCESKEINSQDSEHYLQPHFMDGNIKRDDYLYIYTGYLQFDKTLLYSSAEDSSDEKDYDPNGKGGVRADNPSWREGDAVRSGLDLPSQEHEAFLSYEMRGPAGTGHGGVSMAGGR